MIKGNVSIKSEHGMERVMIRATNAQKELVEELRDNKDKYLRKTDDNQYVLYDNKEMVRLVNEKTVEKLLSVDILKFAEPSNKIILSTLAR